MRTAEFQKWLLLIHQIPPRPNALRVKIWRRLQQVGAVAIKQSVYVMPLSAQSQEDLNWILKEIIEGGGEGSISEARFVEGLSDEQVIALFHAARKSDYEKLIREIDALLPELSQGERDHPDRTVKRTSHLFKLQRRLNDITAIDFFQTPEHVEAKLQIQKLRSLLSEQPVADIKRVGEGMKGLTGKTWVTRENLFVDRIACGWLIRRFVDKSAAFKFVPGPYYTSRPNEIRFDMYDGEYTHEGDRCTFEVMIQQLQIQNHALRPLSEVVHDIDLKDKKFDRNETEGILALLIGLVTSHQDDDQRMIEGIRLFENLYAYYQQ
jgi:hypothetical protein